MTKMSHLSLAYSLEQFIEGSTGINTFIKYDGMTNPDEKPFISIQLMQNNNESLSKQRETVLTNFRFQVGLFANSAWERSQYQEQLRDLFLFSEIPLYDSNGVLTSSSFLIEPDFNETPMPADDLSDVTERHRMYFDLEVIGTFNKK